MAVRWPPVLILVLVFALWTFQQSKQTLTLVSKELLGEDTQEKPAKLPNATNQSNDDGSDKSTTLETTTKKKTTAEDKKSAELETVANVDGLVVDVMSVGSQSRRHYLQAQKESWATSARHFHAITELDDQDPQCRSSTQQQEIRKGIRQCRSKFRTAFLAQYQYQVAKWVLKKPNAAGWICAQKRWGNGMAKIKRFYDNNDSNKPNTTNNNLPDLFLIVDDDTLINMEVLRKELEDFDSNIPMVWAGCLTIYRRKMWRFSPIGGGGMIFTRAALERFLQAIHCQRTKDMFEEQVCSRIHQDLIHERSLWRDGSSLTDLIQAVSNDGFNCFISDQLLGHFVNYYYLSEPWLEEEAFINLTYVPKIHPYRNHFMEFDPVAKPVKLSRNYTCAVQEGDNCTSDSTVCHYVDDIIMKRVASGWQKEGIRQGRSGVLP